MLISSEFQYFSHLELDVNYSAKSQQKERDALSMIKRNPKNSGKYVPPFFCVQKVIVPTMTTGRQGHLKTFELIELPLLG